MKELKEQIAKLRAEVDGIRDLAVSCAEGSVDAGKKLAANHGVSTPEKVQPFLAGLGTAFHVLQSLESTIEKASESMKLKAVEAMGGEGAAKEIEAELAKLRLLATAGKSLSEYLMDDDGEWRDFEEHLAAGNPVEEHVLYQAHVASGEDHPYFEKMVAKYAPEKKNFLKMG
jgi:hypothetical protein